MNICGVHGQFPVGSPPKLQKPKSLHQIPLHVSYAFTSQNPISEDKFVVRAAASAPPLGGDYSGKIVS